MNSFLQGTAIVGVVASFLDNIKRTILALLGLVFIKLDLNSFADSTARKCILFKETKKLGIFLPMSAKKIHYNYKFDKVKKDYNYIVFEDLTAYSGIILRFPLPLLYGISSIGDNNKGSNNENRFLLFFRWTFNYKRFLKNTQTALSGLANKTLLENQQRENIQYNNNNFFVRQVSARHSRDDSSQPSNGTVNEKDSKPAEGYLDLRFLDCYKCYNDNILHYSNEREETDDAFRGYYICDDAKELLKNVECFLRNKSWFYERNIPWNTGILFYGIPGSGKTSLIKKMAQHFGVPIISFDLSTFDNVRFCDAWKEHVYGWSPIIALFEDIDSVFDGRKNITNNSLLKTPLTFNRFLNTIDGVNENSGVITIITTNNIDKIDSALSGQDKHHPTRPGRIDKIIEIKPVDANGRLFLANNILRDTGVDIQTMVNDGDGDTAAQFQNRCIVKALDSYWKKRKD